VATFQAYFPKYTISQVATFHVSPSQSAQPLADPNLTNWPHYSLRRLRRPLGSCLLRNCSIGKLSLKKMPMGKYNTP